jgi:hypothetical protein
MRRLLYFLIVVFILLVITESFSNGDIATIYINEYKQIAIKEMTRGGVPASIKLAQGMLESEWGRSKLAKEAKNHFGIKCGNRWDGPTFYKLDDDYDKDGNLKESCFRVFSTVEESFINHTDFLKDPNKQMRYGFLFKYAPQDYTSWANGLLASGYASDPQYPQKLIGIIEKYKLYELDKKGINKDADSYIKIDVSTIHNEVDVASASSEILTKHTVINADIKVEEAASIFGVEIRKFLSYNEVFTSPKQIIKAGGVVYLEQKNRDYKGKISSHTVKEDETIEEIAHQYGIRSRSLRSINHMKGNTQPRAGSIIFLKR